MLLIVWLLAQLERGVNMLQVADNCHQQANRCITSARRHTCVCWKHESTGISELANSITLYIHVSYVWIKVLTE